MNNYPNDLVKFNNPEVKFGQYQFLSCSSVGVHLFFKYNKVHHYSPLLSHVILCRGQRQNNSKFDFIQGE